MAKEKKFYHLYCDEILERFDNPELLSAFRSAKAGEDWSKKMIEPLEECFPMYADDLLKGGTFTVQYTMDCISTQKVEDVELDVADAQGWIHFVKDGQLLYHRTMIVYETSVKKRALEMNEVVCDCNYEVVKGYGEDNTTRYIYNGKFVPFSTK